jgi:hypothetical protein
MGLVNREKLEKPNTEISHYLGVVVDNRDPEFRGRAKVRVFGLFDQLEDIDLPWSFQRFEMSYGLGGGSGRISVPKIGSVVHVQFNNGNYYSPEYKAVQELSPDLIEEIKSSYDGAHSLIYDGEQNIKIYYTVEQGFVINLKDSKIVISNDNSITINHASTESVIEVLTDTINIASTKEVNIVAETCNIDSPNIKLGDNAIESVIKGDMFKKIYDTHTHPSAGAPPAIPLPSAVLSKNTKTR